MVSESVALGVVLKRPDFYDWKSSPRNKLEIRGKTIANINLKSGHYHLRCTECAERLFFFKVML